VSGPVVHRDVVYSSPVGFRPLALDLYLLPEPASASVTCLYLHGGGWRIGSRRTGPGASARWQPSFFEEVAALGVAIASIDYRLSGEARFPAQLDDVNAAAEFLRRTEFGLPQELAVWGVSSGGHLAALHALRSVGTDLALSAAVCWYTPTDLDALSADVADAGGAPDRSATSREGLLVGGALDDHGSLVASASPALHAGPGAPPFLFLHGTADIAVPPRQSERLADALRSAGGSATVELIEGASHMFPELDDSATRAAVHRSVRFISGPDSAYH
jgi:acetyl esterase/lipase